MGLPVVMNRGVGDSDELIDQVNAIVDAGSLDPDSIEAAAERVLKLDPSQAATDARRAAERWFSLEQVGVARYCLLYERLAA
jgi:glycosyltransferase involved in cell wall biosynthesis